MVNHEDISAPQPSIEFDPLDYGIDVEASENVDERGEAAVDLSEGDLILFALERQLQIVEHDYSNGMTPVDRYYGQSGAIVNAISERRRALWLPDRPGRE